MKLSSPEDTATTKTAADQVLDNNDAATAQIQLNVSKKVNHPQSVFPWRHSPYPLPRLIPNTFEYYTEGGTLGPNFPLFKQWGQNVVWMCSTYLLRKGGDGLGKTSTWFSYYRWKNELEEAFLQAFALGVQGILVNEYNATNTLQTTFPENYNVNVDHTIFPKDEGEQGEGGSNSKDNEDDKNDKSDDEDSVVPELQDMLHSKLQELYKSAHEHAKSKLQIILQCHPKSADIVSLNLINLTREDVRYDPSLETAHLEFSKRIRTEKEEKMPMKMQIEEGISFFEELMEKQQRRVQNDELVVQYTVTAQVAVHCDEIFVVKDLDTGIIVQGDMVTKTNEVGEEEEVYTGITEFPDNAMKEVTHLVRFEIVVDINMNGDLEVGQWQIVDIDDLLNGNIWFST